jgi:hypothetical protein
MGLVPMSNGKTDQSPAIIGIRHTDGRSPIAPRVTLKRTTALAKATRARRCRPIVVP